MEQILIVEGNDAIALAVLCEKRNLPPPVGYAGKRDFAEKFVKKGHGFEGCVKLLKQAIDKPELSNIGIIVDANDKGAEARWQKIRNVLSQRFLPESLSKADLQRGAKIIFEENMPKIGVWVMPNNQNIGYLENFLADLIPTNDRLWERTKSVIFDLEKGKIQKYSPPKKAKAQIHTWLAWQEAPGKPFGQAIESGYFDLKKTEVEVFLKWFADTFELGQR